MGCFLQILLKVLLHFPEIHPSYRFPMLLLLIHTLIVAISSFDVFLFPISFFLSFEIPHQKKTEIPTDCSICCIVDLTFNATDKKVQAKKTQAMIVPSDASENILFLKIFLVPSLIPYKNLLNIIEPLASSCCICPSSI